MGEFEPDGLKISSDGVKVEILVSIELAAQQTFIKASLKGRIKLIVLAKPVLTDESLDVEIEVQDLSWCRRPFLGLGPLRFSPRRMLSKVLNGQRESAGHLIQRKIYELVEQVDLNDLLLSLVDKYQFPYQTLAVRSVALTLLSLSTSHRGIELHGSLAVNIDGNQSPEPPHIKLVCIQEQRPSSAGIFEIDLPAHELNPLLEMMRPSLIEFLPTQNMMLESMRLQVPEQKLILLGKILDPVHVPFRASLRLSFTPFDELLHLDELELHAGEGAGLIAKGMMRLLHAKIEGIIQGHFPLAIRKLRNRLEAMLREMESPGQWKGTLIRVIEIDFEAGLSVQIEKQDSWWITDLKAPSFT